MTDPAATHVEFWFDPVCPWTWLTSRWLLEVADQRPLRIDWNVMSLSVLNADKDVPAQYADLLEKAWGPVRVLTAAKEQYGVEYVLPLFDAMGERFHRDGRSDYDEILRESVVAVGLPVEVAAAARETRWDDALRASHDRAMTLVGDDVGSPVIRLPDVPGSGAYFGPVVNPVPRGEDALRLWTGIEALAATPQLHELKRTRNGEPVID